MYVAYDTPKGVHTNNAAISGKAALPQISAKLLEELIPGPVSKEQFEDIFQNFKKAFIERALSAEMSHQLGYGAGHRSSTLFPGFFGFLRPAGQ